MSKTSSAVGVKRTDRGCILVGDKLWLQGQHATVVAVSKSGRRTVVLAKIDATGTEAWYYYNKDSGYLTAL